MKKESPERKVSGNPATEEFVLVLLNDDINTFDHVIKALIEVCGHDLCQAEQCAMITHFKGSCEVKEGDKAFLLSLSREIRERGMLAKVSHKTQ
jgi:ATP-dependent Clp protease adaptor protein ClpS